MPLQASIYPSWVQCSPFFARRFANWRESVLPIMWYSDFTVVCSSLMRFISNPILPELDGVKPPAPLTLHYNWDILEKGKGVPQNDSEAMSLYQKSARGGYAPAQYRLARIYSEGSLVSRNDILAYAWLQLAATKEIGAHPPVNPQKIKSLLHLLRSRMSPAEISQALRNEKLFSGKS
jgi:hypothetical protein